MNRWTLGLKVAALAMVLAIAAPTQTGPKGGTYPSGGTPTDVSGLVPYTGATSDLNLGTHTLLTQTITSSGTATANTANVTIQGAMAVNLTDRGGTVNIRGGGAILPGLGGLLRGGDVNISGGDAGSSGDAGDVYIDSGQCVNYLEPYPFVAIGTYRASQINFFGLGVNSQITFMRDGGALFKYAPSAPAFVSTVVTGTAPFTVASTTLVGNLNADYLGGQHAAYFAPASTAPAISSGGAAPTSTPGKVGDMYVDTSAKKLYFAAGTISSADWIIAN